MAVILFLAHSLLQVVAEVGVAEAQETTAAPVVAAVALRVTQQVEQVYQDKGLLVELGIVAAAQTVLLAVVVVLPAQGLRATHLLGLVVWVETGQHRPLQALRSTIPLAAMVLVKVA
jgi:hypothetical protein